MSPQQKGGKALVEKYGPDYMRKIGQRGAQTTHKKYKMVPCGTSKFIYIDRKTGEVASKPF